MTSSGSSRSAKMMAASTPRNSAAVMVTSAATCGLLADLEKRVLFADRAVLGHVATGLAHEPDGCAIDRLRLAGANEVGIRGRHEFLNVAVFHGRRCDRGAARRLHHGGHGVHRGNPGLVESPHDWQGFWHARRGRVWRSASAALLFKRRGRPPRPPSTKTCCRFCRITARVAIVRARSRRCRW